MKSTGIVREIDSVGRIVLPKELRDSMDLPEGTPMGIFTDADSIIIRKHEPGCAFCGSMDQTTELHGKHVCGHCREDIQKLHR